MRGGGFQPVVRHAEAQHHGHDRDGHERDCPVRSGVEEEAPGAAQHRQGSGDERGVYGVAGKAPGALEPRHRQQQREDGDVHKRYRAFRRKMMREFWGESPEPPPEPRREYTFEEDLALVLKSQ